MMDSTRCSETGLEMSVREVATFVAAVVEPTVVEVAGAMPVAMVAAGEETTTVTRTREVPPLAPLAKRTSKSTGLATA